MRKIIVSIIVISCLLNVVPFATAVNQTSIETKNELNDNFNIDMTECTFVKKDIESSDNNGLKQRLPELKYRPGEIIVKFKDNCEINFYASAVDFQYVEQAMQQYTGETIIKDIETNSYERGTTDLGESENIQFAEVIMTGFETLDVLNIVYGLTFAEKIIEDDSVPEFSNIYRLYFDDDVNVLNLVEDYNNDTNVEFAEPNYIYNLNNEIPGYNYIKNQQENGFIPNDPYFDMQWALHNTGQNGGTPDADIDAPEAWETTIGDDDVVVAVIDSGVDYTHPDLGSCVQGIIEIVLDESIVITGNDDREIFDFEEIFSNYDFDSISFHFSYVDVGQYCGPSVPPPGAGNLELTSYKKDPDDPYNRCIKRKYLFDSDNYDGIVSNIWTIFSEREAKMLKMDYRIGSGHIGFEIDKVRLHKWEKLSIRCPEKYVDGIDFVDYDWNPFTMDTDEDPMDDNGHGTHCAGIISAVINNGIGIAGVASNCKIMPVKVFDKDGYTTLFIIVRGIYYAAKHGADIVSLSLGGGDSKLLKFIIDYAYKKGVVIIASAGNFGIDFKSLSAPGYYENVIGVAATDRNDRNTGWSNYGAWVDIAAPGYDILSLRAFATDMYLDPRSNYPPGGCFVPQYDNDAILYRASGTSMSCPYVAGVAALILSENPNLTPQEVKTIIRSSSDPIISDKYVGTGRINAYKAVQKTAPVTAEIDDAMDNKNIKGLFSIYGTAKGEKFERYEFQYSNQFYPNEDEWIIIAGSSSTAQKENKKLFVLDTTKFEDGLYTIRLVVVAGGQTYEDRTIVTIDNHVQTYYVDCNAPNGGDGSKDKPFNKIQNAVDICGASDTIYVYSGIYNEQIIIEDKAVKIKGQNKDNTIIDSYGKEYGTIQIWSGCIHLSDITLKSWGMSEGVYNCMDAYHSKDSSITNSRFLSINDLLGSIVFLSLKTSSDNSHNLISGDSLGIVYIVNGKQNTISNNNLKTVILEYSDKNIIHDNNIENNGGDGIYIMEGRKNLIYGNTISNNNNGILLESSSKNIITNNDIKNNNYGICITRFIFGSYSKDNKIYYNNFIGNTYNADDKCSYEDYLNKWYCPILQVGNYWDDYTLKYPGAGIIHRILMPDIYNIPYDIHYGDNKDIYPLVNQCSSSYSNPQSQPQTQPSSQPSSEPISKTTTQNTISSTTLLAKTTSK